MGVLIPAFTLLSRELVRFYRQRSRLIGALATPLLFWILIGSGIGVSFQPNAANGPELSYLEYFYPGTILLVVLFTAIFSTISIIEDRREGFLLSVLVAPTSRLVLVLGKILGGTTLALFQAVLFILLAPLIGISLSVLQLLLTALVLFLIAFALTGLGFTIAWQVDSTQGYHSLMNLLLMPMWLLSGAIFPPSGASLWVNWIMKINPLTYGMAALRRALYYGDASLEGGFPSLKTSLLVMGVFGGVVLMLSFYLTQQRKIRVLG
ncbi:MAG: ABC transporter permease [Acidobacteria bacterium]|nr:ABC transporter permease [Acidobacteriota bacterium]